MFSRVLRSGRVLQGGVPAGRLEETATGFRFTYAPAFLASSNPPVSLTLPKRPEPYEAPHLFPFFVSLLAEGALAEEQCRRLRIDGRDHFGRLLQTAGGDTIGSVQVELEDGP
ncbi:MAG: phosphatidylinositol kinase [Lentisphaerae bacterium]|jgi:HipA-like protein|nr:phosphatidylinositol kinase [Lentisphaerota bacterium]MBT5606421.1 phosphatidylinositol kinase [Lentisphaerota bacterium]MBT7057231.1 phosphatidylinositol kinase [Lentisphaerota bacterium]MBT7843524.1 phosphatidylinositol kinase [Lentisphaerota bacterium]